MLPYYCNHWLCNSKWVKTWCLYNISRFYEHSEQNQTWSGVCRSLLGILADSWELRKVKMLTVAKSEHRLEISFLITSHYTNWAGNRLLLYLSFRFPHCYAILQATKQSHRIAVSVSGLFIKGFLPTGASAD